MAIDILTGDCRVVLSALPSGHFHTCVTSPPYFGLRNYKVEGQLGLEPAPDEFVAELVNVFREVRRVLRDDGTVWLNLGDSYSSGGSTTQVAATLRTAGKDAASGKQEHLNGTACRPPVVAGLGGKQLIGIPWRVAFALQADGWYLRQDIIWSKPNPMPESVRDRCTKSHEYIFLLSKNPRYYFDAKAIAEPGVCPAGTKGAKGSAERAAQRGVNARPPEYKIYDGTRNRRSVWTIATQPFADAHFATFPPKLIEPCILAGCPPGGRILDPFAGAGTTGLVADRLQRNATLIELNPAYACMAAARIRDDGGVFADVKLVGIGENEANPDPKTGACTSVGNRIV